MAWDDLDRDVEPDHLTSLWIPRLAEPVAGEVARFAELVRTLRAECPWDREQTHASLTRHLLEETYEVLDAIDHLDVEAGTGFDALEEELGDLLFQVVFHSVLARRGGPVHAGRRRPRASTTSSTPATRTCSTPRPAPTDVAQLTVDWERRKVEEKGRGQRDGRHPRHAPVARLRGQGAEEGRVAGRRLAGRWCGDDGPVGGPGARPRRRGPRRPASTPSWPCAGRCRPPPTLFALPLGQARLARRVGSRGGRRGGRRRRGGGASSAGLERRGAARGRR